MTLSLGLKVASVFVAFGCKASETLLLVTVIVDDGAAGSLHELGAASGTLPTDAFRPLTERQRCRGTVSSRSIRRFDCYRRHLLHKVTIFDHLVGATAPSPLPMALTHADAKAHVLLACGGDPSTATGLTVARVAQILNPQATTYSHA